MRSEGDRVGGLGAALAALRAHQWIKNLLVFVPLIMAHRVFDAAALAHAGYAFAAWCLCASAVYVTNDLLDAEADRSHPYKKRRPLASGRLSARAALVLIPALLVPGLAVALLLLPALFALSLALYLALTTAYSLSLKRVAIVDVMVLAGLYTLRVVSGGLATGIEVSPWLLAFSMFLFLSLAFVKRYTELREHGGEGSRRGYARDDMALLKSFGTASGYLSVLVLALYINNSREVTVLYRRPGALWLVGPCLLYWVTRVWLLADRGRLHDDPVVFTVKDPASYVVGAAVALLIIAATV
ncbi:MAG TPA: UbiA family prenyltransferase [Pyrinomonadaceae bacterium]|nr:UbiA family prenyltransferase [Pyrinomonadaceae bacterium]